MDLSVIIPVYNTPEENLIRCFSSICFPDEITFEVLVIDDGSEKDTGEFCRSYAEAHENFRYFYQENKGVSAARNAGLLWATGEYIMFVDADDEFIPYSIKSEHLDSDWDIVFFDFDLCIEGHTETRRLFTQGLKDTLEKKDFVVAACNNRTNTVWAKLIRRLLLLENDIGFDESMVVAEDAQFIFSAILKAHRLTYVNTVVYHYSYSNDNGNSRLMRFSKRILENTINYYESKKRALNEYSAELRLSKSETNTLYAIISEQLVKDLFEAVGSLLLLGIICTEMNEIIWHLIRGLPNEVKKDFSFRTKIKLFLLKYDFVSLIKVCARLRVIYIRRKR